VDEGSGTGQEDRVSMQEVKADSAEDWMLPALQARSRESRDRLLKAGEEAFATHGFTDTHISQIVAAAGCSTGSFYRRFKDKEALFLALQEEMHLQAREKIDKFFSHPACVSRPLTAVFLRLIENSDRDALRIKGYYRALFELSLRGRSVWDRMRDLERYQAERIKDLLARRGIGDVRSDFVAAIALALRVIAGGQLSLMLHGPDAFNRSSGESHAEFTRILMRAAGLVPDEAILATAGARGQANGTG
jgi:AcrR family transcriptional regulator